MIKGMVLWKIFLGIPKFRKKWFFNAYLLCFIKNNLFLIEISKIICNILKLETIDEIKYYKLQKFIIILN